MESPATKSQSINNDVLIFVALVLSGLTVSGAVWGRHELRSPQATRSEEIRQVPPPSLDEQIREMLNHD